MTNPHMRIGLQRVMAGSLLDRMLDLGYTVEAENDKGNMTKNAGCEPTKL